MTRERRPIPARALIVGAILAVAALGLTIVGGVTFLAQRDRTLTDIDERLISQIDVLDQVDELRVVVESGAVASAQDTPDNFTDLEAYLRAAVSRLIPGRNEASIAVIDGRIAFRSANTLSQQIADDPDFVAEAVATAKPADQAVIASASIGSTDLRYIAVPVSQPGDDRTGVYIRAVDVTRELEPVTLSLLTYTAAALATLAAIGIVGWFVAGRILSPIRRMRETADSITPTDLRARIPADGNDDISDLSRTVNSMLDRLEGSMDNQRQLLDDVRHELKTPITIVRGHLEMMDVANPADVASTRDIGIAELDRMTRLVEDIDLLSSAEGDQFEISLVDVRELTERMGDLVGGFPGHSWSVAGIARGVIEGDYDRLLQAWLQLADNATKYTPQGSPIEIGSTLDIDSVHLWVRDHGPGIPPAARRRIFHRFARADHRTVGGSGLGLAIVDAIAKAHLGTCAVTDTDGGGATFTITLPITQGRSELLPSPVRAGDVVLQREATG
ncbi:Signal transduction histidine kinase [Microbacterium sp. C448]|uniref:sensor histidine kinase n=1 Tax=Microbacterium sp. C448 TaxID=1177594 RepID=UPI0003DE5DEB|nr:HAMP domain-containing sensor histidine kinase [Microbacterium sp. C448]CDJ99181.1 Signal transduction histidine kinase [Microbacterium sp. C448]|tara:strand:+ start:2508 stop:4016 length:1509 start_codon:yes stop_codon:yes gene_type:complete